MLKSELNVLREFFAQSCRTLGLLIFEFQASSAVRLKIRFNNSRKNEIGNHELRDFKSKIRFILELFERFVIL